MFSGKNIIINNVDIFVSYNFKFLNLSFENWEYMMTGIFMFLGENILIKYLFSYLK